MNLASVVRVNANNHGARPAIICGDEVTSYAGLWSGIEAVARHLLEWGVAPGDRVGLAMKDHPLHLLAHYAVARIGAVILPIDHRWTGAEKQSAAAAFDAAVVLTDGESIEQTRTRTLDAASLPDSDADLPDIDADEDSDLLISLSSGTTGRPKGALVTHRNLYERFVSQWAAIGYDSKDCFALVTPLFFGAGRSFGMSMLAVGGTVLLAPPPLKPPELAAVLSRPEVTATFLPPTLLRRLLPLHEASTPPLLGHLDYLIASGEPLHADEARQCIERICPNLLSYYASSEGGGISVLKARDFEAHAASVGIPTFRTEVQIVDSDDNELPAGEVGRLRYRGPGVATRYLDSDGSPQSVGSDGWFYPGDLAVRLESGHIALRGRDRDVIIRGGVNIYPPEIESAILGHPDVAEAAVLGIEDGERGQVVVACVAPAVNEALLRTFLEDRLAPYKLPERYCLLDSLPRHSSGKVDKHALSSRVAAAL